MVVRLQCGVESARMIAVWVKEGLQFKAVADGAWIVVTFSGGF